jgi:signal transduction histidine kinase
MGRLFRVAVALFRGDFLHAVGLLRGSLAIALIFNSLILLFVPALLGALAIARIVTNRVRFLQEQREGEIALIEQQRNQFLTDVAHDLRTPLMAISGMAHAIDDGVVHDEAMREAYVRSIGDKADKLGELVATVFDYAKTGSGTFKLERAQVDLPQLLLREAAIAYADIEAAGMQLSVDVSEEPCCVDADVTQLARVVANLLTNAMRHNAEGTEIALLLVRRVGIAYVVVADTGGTIEQSADELFRPFSRGDASRSKPGDTGLGLSICKRIADMHGYDLSLVQPYGRFSKAFVLTCVVVA